MHSNSDVSWSITCRDGTEMMAATLNVYKLVYSFQKSALHVVISLYEPYLSFSSVFISNKTLSAAREYTEVPHRQVAKIMSKSSIFFLSFSFSQATTILTETIKMIHTRRSGICIRALHSYQSASFQRTQSFRQ